MVHRQLNKLKNELVLIGQREPTTGLWVLLITPAIKPNRKSTFSDLKMMEMLSNRNSHHAKCIQCQIHSRTCNIFTSMPV